MAVTESLTVSNVNSFTTTAGTEAVVAIVAVPWDNATGYGNTLNASVNFTAVNAATTALTVKVRQASYSGGNVVISSPAGTQIGTSATHTFTAGTLSTDVVNTTVLDQAPTLISATASVPAQAASNNAPGTVLQGAGVAYVLTVTSTTNVATVAAGAATLTVTQGSPAD